MGFGLSCNLTMEKEKYQIEFPVNSSKGVLFNAFSTPSGLAEWFCDDVNIKKDVHIFVWEGSEESGSPEIQMNNSIRAFSKLPIKITPQ